MQAVWESEAEIIILLAVVAAQVFAVEAGLVPQAVECLEAAVLWEVGER